MGVENMTAADLLRKAADGSPIEDSKGVLWRNPENKLVILSGDEIGDPESKENSFRALADKVEAELEAARSEPLRQGAELWAKANGWPAFREGEDFGAWLERCALPRLTYEDGAPVQFGDRTEYGEVEGATYWGKNAGPDIGLVTLKTVENGSVNVSVRDLIKRADPEVLDADGVPIEVGDTVWIVGGAVSGEVYIVRSRSAAYVNWSDGRWSPEILASRLTHKQPVFDADNKEIKVGDTVWSLDSGQDYEVMDFANRAAGLVQCRSLETGDCEDIDAKNLTHNEPDSMERIREDALRSMVGYWGCSGYACSECPAEVDGKTPSERYGTYDDCQRAQRLDLLARAERVMGGE